MEPAWMRALRRRLPVLMRVSAVLVAANAASYDTGLMVDVAEARPVDRQRWLALVAMVPLAVWLLRSTRRR